MGYYIAILSGRLPIAEADRAIYRELVKSGEVIERISGVTPWDMENIALFNSEDWSNIVISSTTRVPKSWEMHLPEISGRFSKQMKVPFLHSSIWGSDIWHLFLYEEGNVSCQSYSAHALSIGGMSDTKQSLHEVTRPERDRLSVVTGVPTSRFASYLGESDRSTKVHADDLYTRDDPLVLYDLLHQLGVLDRSTVAQGKGIAAFQYRVLERNRSG